MTEGPLEGIRIVDFSHIAAGPYGTLQLAYWGAEVIKVESRTHLDGWRVRDGNRHIEASRPYADHNKNKLNVTIDLKKPQGFQLALRLIAKADAVVENFSFGVMERLGLSDDVMRAAKEDLVILHLQGLGSSGPHRHWVTWGPSLMPFCGMTYLWNLPEQPEPVGSQSSYPDYVVGVHAALALLAALWYRKRTGEGVTFDLAQAEITASLLAPAYMEYLVNGTDPQPRGNSHPDYVPYGCYPCAGDDQWCMIAVTNESEWRSLCQVMGREDWLCDHRFATLPNRLRHRALLDSLIAEWTRGHQAVDLMRKLQARGVPAGVVADGRELAEDPQLAYRGFLVDTHHPYVTHLLPGPVGRLTRTPGRVVRHAPLLGQDNERVFRGLLGLSVEEYRAAVEEGIIA